MASTSSSGKRTVLTYIGLSFLCLLFIISSENKVVLFLKDVENTLFYPFRLVVRGIQQELVAFKSIFVGKNDVKIELEKLKVELENYKRQIVNLNVTQEENDKLRDLLGLKKDLEYDSIISSVIGRDFSYAYSYITINKGRMDGIVDHLPVVAFVNGVKSVVGIVSEATLLTSKVRTLKSDLSSMGVYLPRTDVHSVVEGLGGTSQEIQLLYIDKDVPIERGDMLYTSVESRLFPPNFLVGTISNVDSTKKTSTSYRVYVSPAVKFHQLSEVFVLKPKQDQ